MKFALLGDDPNALPLSRAVATHSQHTLVCTVAAPRSHEELLRVCPKLRAERSWEDLLLEAALDAVVIAGEDEEILNGARQLAEAGKSLLVIPAVAATGTLALELTLLQTDRPVTLFPIFTVRVHPLVRRFREALILGELGAVRHVQLERHPVVAHQSAAGLILPRVAQEAFLEDAHLLRFLFGDYNQVTASRSGEAATGFSLVSITLAGKGAPQAVWSMTITPGSSPWRLSITGEKGSATLSGDSARGDFSLEIHASGKTAESATAVVDPGQELLREFESLCGAPQTGDQPAAAPLPTWIDLTRDLEVLEAVERSVKRRRTIDLYFDPPSERGMFKTQMTAIGCGLLTFTLFAVVAYLGAAATLDLAPALKRTLVALIFAPLGLFLALQAFLFVTRTSPADRPR